MIRFPRYLDGVRLSRNGPSLAWPSGRCLLISCGLILTSWIWAGNAVADIQPYSARYSIYRNGKLTGKAEVTLQQQGENWIIESESSGTHGLAHLLHARDSEKVIGRVIDGHFLPEQYSRNTQLAGMDDLWTAYFDWGAQSVQIRKGDNILTLELEQRALDPLSLKLEMRQRLANQNPDLDFWMVDEDEIDAQNFRVLRSEKLETSLGCLETTPVEKVSINSTRYTRAWHAPVLDHVAVRIEHGKVGGNQMELRITELKLAGTMITPQLGCSTLRSDAAASDMK